MESRIFLASVAPTAGRFRVEISARVERETRKGGTTGGRTAGTESVFPDGKDRSDQVEGPAGHRESAW